MLDLARLARDPGIERDYYCSGGVVAEVERRFAAQLGKERAIYLPSGTLSNHMAVRRLAPPNACRVLVQCDSHLYNDEGDCAQTLSGLNLMPLARGRANVTVADVEHALADTASSRVRTAVGVISIESPVRRHQNEIVDIEELERIYRFAQTEGIRVHLDGARLPVAEAFSGIPQRRCAAACDTVFVSLYKLYNAASGAILAGSTEMIEGLEHERRMFGGSLHFAWPLAAVGLAYHAEFAQRFAGAMAAAEQLYAALAGDGRFEVAVVPRGTSVRRVRLKRGDPTEFRVRLKRDAIELPKPAADGWFHCKTNESLVRRPIAELIDSFVAG